MERRTASRMLKGKATGLAKPTLANFSTDSSAFSVGRCSRFWPKSRFGWCARGRLFWQLSEETRFACCRPDSSQLLMGHTEQPVFAIVPNLVLVQLHGQLPELLLPVLEIEDCCNS